MTKEKKYWTYVLIILAVGGGLLLFLSVKGGDVSRLGTDLQETPSKTATLFTPEEFFDFGIISMAAGNVSHAFKIKNTGTEPIVISKVYTSCMCTTATLTTQEGAVGPFGMPGHAAIPSIKQSIAPNEEASVEIVYDPAAHGPAATGKVRRTVYLETDAQKEPFELSFEANVTP